MYMPFGGMSGERAKDHVTNNSCALLPSPLRSELYLMYIQSHPVILQFPRVVESLR